MVARPAKPLEVAVAGLGAIGIVVARRLAAGIDGLKLTGVVGRTPDRAAATVAGIQPAPRVMTLPEAVAAADVIVDCAPSGAFPALAGAAVEAGRMLVTVNAAALLSNLGLVERARATGGRIVVASGALLALDAVAAAAEGEIRSITMVTRKPPAGLDGAPYLVERGIKLAGLTAPLKVFEGTAGEGAKGFPANVNVAAALSLAGLGPDRTRLEIWADPGVDRNLQSFEVEADSSRFRVQIENVPSAENPRTGRITALSVVATLRRLTAPLRVGT